MICLSNDDCETVADLLISEGLPVFVRRRGEYTRTPATSFIEFSADWCNSERGKAGKPLAELLWQWRQLLGPAAERRLDIEFARILLDFPGSDDPQASLFVERLLGLGLLDALDRSPSRAEDAAAVRDLRKATTEGKLAGLTLAQLGDRAIARNRIHVVTMHGSKGLEFDLVCAVGLEATRLPRYKAPPWEQLQQRRQFYVTVTRARDAVHLFYTGWMTNRFGKRYEHGPSPFLLELNA